ncbi:hypothetical protein CFIMG_007952RA00001 [Ceratocystis fimbriata CBS 114723]|uniref:Uncharacterized protein n=1 Tax=Ceratocystis fimbriata CBS 114723 TaxID=1035309 RepID=A0A2C5X9D8_9PEZI|nr:hypothetical protein CFIMG_007952RA00001 [Ceratocystis fimbriata CBS 114723]
MYAPDEDGQEELRIYKQPNQGNIKSDSVLQETEDNSILESFTQAELRSPSLHKIANNLPIYASRRFDSPKVSGSAV